MASSQSSSTLPQGFSVYQPTLGAPLQFFPALGSQQLDDLINAFIPGPSPASEKRATISLDFLEYAQMTGQASKFYAVNSVSAATSPSLASPSLDSVNSSFNVSPVTSSWDWSATSATSAPSVSSSSRGSTQHRRQSKTNSPPSRYRTTDFSHLPGMKILTKDGQDVTNSASRGSKTKEQRDHAHLMRIIKACDSCRRKKIRCDPSHKKRGAAQVASQPASKPAKKARTVPQDPPPCPPPATVVDTELLFSSSLSAFDVESSFDFSGLENLDPATLPYDPFDEFVHFPAMDTPDLDLFLEPGDYLSSQPTTTASSSSAASPLKSLTPSSQPELAAPPGGEFVSPDLQESPPNFPYLERSGSSSDYTDFNLYSPESSFSEDERMLSIGISTGSLPSLNEPSLSECPPPLHETIPDGEASEWNGPGLSVDELQFHFANEAVGGSGSSPLSSSSSGQFATTNHVTAGESVNEYGSRPNRVPISEPLNQVDIGCPPDTIVVGGDTSPGGQDLDNVRTRLHRSSTIEQTPTSQKVPTGSNSSVASASIDVGESSDIFTDQSIATPTSGVSNKIRGDSPAELAHQSSSVSVSTSRIHVIPPRTTSNSDQDNTAFVESPASIGLDSAVQSASSEGVQLMSTNSLPESTDVSSSLPVHNRPTGIERLVRENSPTQDVSSAERASPDERHKSSSAACAQTGLCSSPVANDESARGHGESTLDIVEDSVVSQMSTRTTSLCRDHNRSSHRHINLDAPAREPTLVSDEVSLNAPTNASASTVGGEGVRISTGAIHNPSRPTLPRLQSAPPPDAQSNAPLASMAHTAAFMSNLALYVMAAAVTATHGDVLSRTRSVTASCRTVSGRSSPRLHAVSPLCVV